MEKNDTQNSEKNTYDIRIIDVAALYDYNRFKGKQYPVEYTDKYFDIRIQVLKKEEGDATMADFSRAEILRSELFTLGRTIQYLFLREQDDFQYFAQINLEKFVKIITKKYIENKESRKIWKKIFRKLLHIHKTEKYEGFRQVLDDLHELCVEM